MIANGMPQPECLTEEDFYCYLTQEGNGERFSRLESHLANCANCRRALADLIDLLHPENNQQSSGFSEPTEGEIEETVNLVGRMSRRGRRYVSPWLRWPIAAAAAVGFIAVCLLGARYFYETNKSETFFTQAEAIVDQNYTGTSPSNLRLALPFIATSTERKVAEQENLRSAENLFFQALAVREDMIEAHLGLGYIYLSESKFTRARDEFRKVLDIKKGQNQALIGRGVAEYEEAVKSQDALDRITLLKGALGDFDAVLKVAPDTVEARYDRIWTLFESGLHKEAIREIDLYLSRDSDSIWAGELKKLKSKMQAARSSLVKDEVDRAARLRDGAALSELCRLAPYQIPAAIWSAMARSLQQDPTPGKSAKPDSDDLRWAAESMEASYGDATGDHSFKAFIAFYDGLSPPERQIKRSLDLEFQSLVKSYQSGKFDSVLLRSKPLEIRYSQINDSWQLLNLHNMRGNSLYLGKADFQGAEAEFLKMLRIAERLAAPEPTAKALAALAGVFSMKRKFDASLSGAKRLRDLARKYHLESWQIYAALTIGNQYHRLGQSKLALQEYTEALSLACRLSDAMKISEALERSGLVMESDGRLKEAEALYGLAVQRQDSFLKSQATQPMPDFAVRHLNLISRQADLALRAGEYTQAESLFKASLRAAESGMRELEARDRIGLAEIYLQTGRIQEAETLLDPAISAGESGHYPEIEWKAKFLKGRVFERTGRTQEALACYRQSIGVLERMRQKVTSDDLRQSFLNERFDPFKAIVDLLFKSADKGRALEFVEMAKAATLREDLKFLNSSAQPAAKLVESRYPVLEYFFTNEGLLIFLTSRDRVEAAYQNVSSKELSHQLDEFLGCIKRNDSGKFTEMARLFYKELIGPVEKYIFSNQPQTLVILPDGPLHLMPFAGLMNSRGEFLIERSPLALAPSRIVFNHCLFLPREGDMKDPRAALIDGSQSLPFARDELRYISTLYGGNASVLGLPDSPGFKRRLETAGILHFSGHAVMKEGRPVLIVQTLPTEISIDCKTIRTWNLPKLKLVNLAGCNTAVGPVAEGESPWGLIPAFLNTGATAIIASLLPVDDESTTKLNCRFYDLLKNGMSTAKALQLAQVALLDSARRHSEIRPQSWVPYTLVGNPQ
jgi:CHAT domain-containing protein/thioredoxin-like negative regulator of GroEL